MNLESAKSSLENLKAQLKEAQERVILLTGAVQGAEIIFQSLEEKVAEPVESESATIVKKTNSRK